MFVPMLITSCSPNVLSWTVKLELLGRCTTNGLNHQESCAANPIVIASTCMHASRQFSATDEWTKMPTHTLIAEPKSPPAQDHMQDPCMETVCIQTILRMSISWSQPLYCCTCSAQNRQAIACITLIRQEPATCVSAHKHVQALWQATPPFLLAMAVWHACTCAGLLGSSML